MSKWAKTNVLAHLIIHYKAKIEFENRTQVKKRIQLKKLKPDYLQPSQVYLEVQQVQWGLAAMGELVYLTDFYLIVIILISCLIYLGLTFRCGIN